MSGVPYTFASATSSIPLSELDTNFATPVTIGTTSVALGNTVTTLANVALANVTISSVASGIPNNFLANSSVTIGNTSVALGNTVTSLGNVTLTNATISSVASQIPAAAMPTGSVIQVVQYTDNTLRTSTSNVAVYSGFSANITPQFSTSKILVIFNGSLSVNGNTNSNIIMGGAIYRGSSTQLNGFRIGGSPLVNGDFNTASASTYLDSPATTSTVNYQFWWSRYNSTFDTNLTMNTATGQFGAGWSSFILLEIR